MPAGIVIQACELDVLVETQTVALEDSGTPSENDVSSVAPLITSPESTVIVYRNGGVALPV